MKGGVFAKVDYSVQVWTFMQSPQNWNLTPHPHEGGALANNISVQIWTFHSIPSKKNIFVLVFFYIDIFITTHHHEGWGW